MCLTRDRNERAFLETRWYFLHITANFFLRIPRQEWKKKGENRDVSHKGSRHYGVSRLMEMETMGAALRSTLLVTALRYLYDNTFSRLYFANGTTFGRPGDLHGFLSYFIDWMKQHADNYRLRKKWAASASVIESRNVMTFIIYRSKYTGKRALTFRLFDRRQWYGKFSVCNIKADCKNNIFMDIVILLN